MNFPLSKMLKIVLYIILGLLLAGYLIFRFGMSGISQSQEKIDDFFSERNLSPKFDTYTVEGHHMHYVDIGATTLPTIIFIHGSPGSWDAFMQYMGDSSLLKCFRMISVDRIGYGKSDFRQPESSVYMQAACIQPLLDMVPDSVPVILVGHSFGGPIAYRMAMEYPDKIDGMLILAGLADPDKEKRLWIQKPLRSKWLRWLLPPMMDISNREIVPLKRELQIMKPMWGEITAKTTIIQGQKDILVHYAHGEFAMKMITNGEVKYISLPKANHFLPWSHYELVHQEILALRDRITLMIE